MFRYALVIVLALWATTSCKKERFFTGDSLLQFSDWDDYTLDTLTFDTIFTREPGTNNPISVTHKFWVKNNEKQTVKANFILAGGSSSPYRFTINGKQGPTINNVEIAAGDSVWGFLQCTLEANNLTQPALVMDSILANVGNTQKKLYLAAYGWDAHYVRSSALPCGGSWTDKVKPYVIVNSALVPQGCNFTIKEGVTVYNSPRSALLVQGSLKIEGTASERVRFTGSLPRFDAQNLPGQWGGIIFYKNSINNSIAYANINNAAIGILDSTGPNHLKLNQVQIKYSGQVALLSISANTQATNCEFTEAGSYCFLGLTGGNYSFNHCTFASFVNYTNRSEGLFALTNTLRNENGAILKLNPLACVLSNCIIYGSRRDEIILDSSNLSSFSFTGSSNIIKNSTKHLPVSTNFYDIDPKFLSINKSIYMLDTLSPAQNKGIISSPAVLIDLLGKTRTAPPDIGAYERFD